MSTLTHLCLNRLDSEPYLHRLIPHLTHFAEEYPQHQLIVLTDKELLANGLYMSLIEHRIPVELYNQYHRIPLNFLVGEPQCLLNRLDRFRLLPNTLAQHQTDIFANQLTHTAISHGLTLIKRLKNNQATLADLINLLNNPEHRGQQMLTQFQSLDNQTLLEEQSQKEVSHWFLHHYFNPSPQTKMKPFEYTALGRLKLEQFQAEWRQIFSTDHQPQHFFHQQINLIDVSHLTKTKKALMLYLLELIGKHSKTHPNVSLILDLSLTIPDEEWEQLLLNYDLEVTQVQHIPKENELLASTYTTRSIKHFRYYSIAHKEKVLEAIYRFKCPHQLAIEREQQTTSQQKRAIERAISLYDVIDFSSPC